jgi:hypothetical protein
MMGTIGLIIVIALVASSNSSSSTVFEFSTRCTLHGDERSCSHWDCTRVGCPKVDVSLIRKGNIRWEREVQRIQLTRPCREKPVLKPQKAYKIAGKSRLPLGSLRSSNKQSRRSKRRELKLIEKVPVVRMGQAISILQPRTMFLS